MPDYGERTEFASTTMHPSGGDPESELEQKIHLLFNRSVSSVQDYSSKVQRTYLSPALAKARIFNETYPVLSLFVGIYSVLSLLPIVTFLFFAIFVLFVSVVVALTVSIIFSGLVISSFGFLLFCALFWNSLVSIWATTLAISAYQFKQLVVNLREELTWQGGIKKWAFELRESALSRLPTHNYGGITSVQEPLRVAKSEDVTAKVEADESGHS